MRGKALRFVITSFLIGLAFYGDRAGALGEANQPACATPEKAAATFFTGLLRGEEALQRTCVAEDVPLPRPLPVEVTGYELIVSRPAQLPGAVFRSWERQTPYRTESGDVQIGVDLLGPWDRQANVRVGEGWLFLRPKGTDRWEIHKADTLADLTPQKGGPLRPGPAPECATPAQAVRSFLQGNITRNRRLALQCTYFWTWTTDRPQYVAHYTIQRPMPIPPSMVGQQGRRFTYMQGDLYLPVAYRLAPQYRGLLRKGTRPQLQFYLRRSAEGEWKILDVIHEYED